LRVEKQQATRIISINFQKEQNNIEERNNNQMAMTTQSRLTQQNP